MPDRTRAKYRGALEAILNGHPDPRHLAQQVLAYKRTTRTYSLVGEVFGDLEVIFDGGLHRIRKRATPKAGTTTRMWLCMCACGNLTTRRTSALTSGHARSCGCHRKFVQKVNLSAKNTKKVKIPYAGYEPAQPDGGKLDRAHNRVAARSKNGFHWSKEFRNV